LVKKLVALSEVLQESVVCTECDQLYARVRERGVRGEREGGGGKGEGGGDRDGKGEEGEGKGRRRGRGGRRRKTGNYIIKGWKPAKTT